MFHFISGMSSFPLTNSIIFRRCWNHQPDQCLHPVQFLWKHWKQPGWIQFQPGWISFLNESTSEPISVDPKMGHTLQKHIIILRFEHEFGAVLRTKSKTAMKWVDPIPIFHRFPISMAILLVIQRHAPKPRSQAHVREQRASECRDLRRCGDLGTGDG